MRSFGLVLSIVAEPALAQVVDSAAPIPMRDGVVLRATVLRPSASGRSPTLVYRTPYSQRNSVRSYSIFKHAVERGYAVVAQDVRGRYLSDGEFNPYLQEGKDGYDTIEWAAAQPWSTGDVGTFGLSYPGAVQWLAAVESPPHLKAMVPAMTFSRPTNFWYAGGLIDNSWPAWIWLNIAPDIRRRKSLTGPQTGAEARQAWRALREELPFRLPLTRVPELRDVAPWFFGWLAHPPNDEWWDWADLTTKYGRVSAAVLNLSGWHDDNYGPEGALSNHLGLLRSRASAADPQSYLILGPWVHGISGMNDRSKDAGSGERIFGSSAGIDYDDEILDLMDRYVRGVQNGLEKTARFRIFVMGENVWVTGDTWPLPGVRPTRLFFDPTGKLTWREPATGQRSFVSDPANPVVDPFAAESGAHDYRALTTRRDVLVYETEPLEADLRIVGNLTVALFASAAAPDFDLWAQIFDVAPDGTAWNRMSPGLATQRASYRDGKTRALLDPGEIAEVTLANLLTANLFKRGHRIRMVISGSFMPHMSRNLQTGKLETESADTRRAAITVHSGAGQLSHLVLPVLP